MMKKTILTGVLLWSILFLCACTTPEYKIPRLQTEPYLSFPQPPYTDLPKAPIEIRFFPEKAGNTAETYYQVTEELGEQNFSFQVVYYYTDATHQHVINLARGIKDFKTDQFIKLPAIGKVRLRVWTINGMQEILLHEKEYLPQVTGGGGGKGGGRLLQNLVNFNLKPGLYRVQITSLRDSPDLAGTYITLSSSYLTKF